jgi:hypothetical protein
VEPVPTPVPEAAPVDVPAELPPEAAPVEAQPPVEAEPAPEPAPTNAALAAEALAAVVGVVPKKPITADDRLVAGKLPQKWRAKVRRFLHSDPEPIIHAPVIDLEKVLDKLTEPNEDLDRVLGDLIDPGISSAVLNVIAGARQYLTARWPTVVVEGITGPELMEVSPQDKQAAAALFRVVDEPNHLLDEMLSRTLEPDQAAAFAASYPNLAEMLTSIIWDEIASLGKKRVSWDRELVLRVLWNVPPQTQITTPRAQPKVPPSKSEPDQLQTKAQRLAT